FADSGLAYRSAGSSAQTSKADSPCCRLSRVRPAHGICVHTGHERRAARDNVRPEGSPGWGRARLGAASRPRDYGLTLPASDPRATNFLPELGDVAFWP